MKWIIFLRIKSTKGSFTLSPELFGENQLARVSSLFYFFVFSYIVDYYIMGLGTKNYISHEVLTLFLLIINIEYLVVKLSVPRYFNEYEAINGYGPAHPSSWIGGLFYNVMP
ncbi:hypothetical protein HanRHA438_Chr14g0680781 [Helianthus annuus]|uniref:Uncharacterized protein n=1 Tax=Helianthus annuus TaxID=4232 RepID=A0A9K3HAI9_HELAN|nr:hypothetical protein HanXRQr2_Chr14g0669001 [Helianthus annuus]KAJ0466153.1 hypothetical protein HanHA300_Chr14g0545981 [Helianthus annuus]KAJ0471137.1 hypothetical protein HanIR_Chr14g0726421 [Helianthus annuus]KAJ0487714.1 hypothetical protein HanHA89_Chr14g0593431 [Helianthus annuus]KAJ0658177.1 hypothetical protein HanLR1_Chr14g0554851 [Helianthus annuus]